MDKLLWNTLTIKVPEEMVTFTKTGKVSIKKTLTKYGISRNQKQPSIKLIPSNDNKVHIVNEGKEWNVGELEDTMKKVKDMAKKNKDRVLTKNTHAMKKTFTKNVKAKAQSLVDERLGIDPTVKGYSWNNQKNKWGARIKINQKIIHLGFFDNEEDAHNAYLVAKREQLRND